MSFSGKKFLVFGFIFILLAAIPLTVWLITQTSNQNTETRSRALKATRITLSPASTSTSVGSTVSFDVNLDPGSNNVTFVKLVITYDPTKLATTSSGIVVTQNTPTVLSNILEGPLYSDGKISLTLTAGSDASQVITAPTKIATVSFTALAETNGATTQIAFADADMVVTSVNSPADQRSENVLSSTAPAEVTIAAGSGTTPTPTTGDTPTPGPTNGQNQSPICTALNLDRETSGNAPYTLTFTAIGNDPDGTISKVTFNFGDGPVQDVTVGGGIGTNTISTQVSHTYNNAGTYTANAVITDSNGGVSESGTCTQTITVTSVTPTAGGGGTFATATPIPTEIVVLPTATPPIPVTTLPAAGSKDILIGIGGAGLLTILGIIALFAL